MAKFRVTVERVFTEHYEVEARSKSDAAFKASQSEPIEKYESGLRVVGVGTIGDQASWLALKDETADEVL